MILVFTVLRTSNSVTARSAIYRLVRFDFRCVVTPLTLSHCREEQFAPGPGVRANDLFSTLHPIGKKTTGACDRRPANYIVQYIQYILCTVQYLVVKTPGGGSTHPI